MKKSEIIFNVISIILVLAIIMVCIYISNSIMKDKNKVYVQKWICNETGVCYLITNTSIIEMHNPDGTIYIEK